MMFIGKIDVEKVYLKVVVIDKVDKTDIYIEMTLIKWDTTVI